MANTEKIVVQVVVKGEKDLNRVGKSADKSTKSFGKMAAGVLGAVAAFKTISSAIGSAIKTFKAFEFQMAKVKAITGASSKDFLKLSKTAEDLGRSTFFTAQQVAELQTNYGKLGFTTQEILNAQEATLNLATATGSDLARAATVAGASVRGFGLDASETQRVVDVMAVAFTSSAMDIEKWQTSMTKVAPIAKASGFSIEDTAAMMSKLTDAGIEASIAGTSLRNILLKMQDPNSDLTKSFGKTIHSFDELVPAMQKFVTEGGSMADIMEVVDLRQAAAFEQMITSADSTLQLRDSLLDASGAAQKMSDIVGDNLEGATRRFTSAWEGLMINFTESIIGKGLQSFVDKAASLVNVVSDFVDIPMSEKLEQNRISLNAMVLQLTQANIKEEDRKKLITEINLQYPDFLENIDTEKTSTKQLKERLSQYNDELINKILLQKEDEKLNKITSDAADAKAEKMRTERELMSELIKTSEEHNIALLDGATTSEQYSHIKETLTSRLTGFGSALDPAKKSLDELNGFVVRSGWANMELTKHTEELNVATEDRNSLAKQLGLTLEDEIIVEDKVIKKKKTSTAVTVANTEAKKENSKLDVIATANLEKYLTLQEDVISGKKTQSEFDDAYVQHQISLLNQVLLHDELTTEQRMQLQKKLNDLKIQGMADEKTVRQEQIDGVAQLGSQLINLAGQDEKYQKVREAGIKISAAAALANNMEALSLQAKSLSKDLALGFPQNIIAIASTLALIMSIKSNLSALSGGKMARGGMVEEFANGGMVHGKSHAQGGEKFAVGGRVVELEGGEAVINKRSTAMFGRQLSAMNAAGGGVKFADGGLLNQPSFSQQQFNAIGQNQMMGAMGSSSKVVVVEADITDSQNSVSVIQSEATI